MHHLTSAGSEVVYKHRIQSVAPMMVMSQPMLCRCRCRFGSFAATSSCTALVMWEPMSVPALAVFRASLPPRLLGHQMENTLTATGSTKSWAAGWAVTFVGSYRLLSCD